MTKAIFITGAGAGIGAATARRLASHGWKVGLYDIDFDAVTQLAAELGPDKARAGQLDVTSEADWQRCLTDFYGWQNRLDVLLNNAGILYSGHFESIAAHDYARLLEINVHGVVLGCQTALPYLRQTPHSRVINLSSASAIYGQASLAVYSASKFAVRGLTEALDNEWQPYGIRVMDILPFFVKTAMLENMDAASVRKVSMRQTPEDVAQVIERAATSNPKFAPTHWPVGLAVKLLGSISSVSPDRVNRLVNGWLTTD